MSDSLETDKAQSSSQMPIGVTLKGAREGRDMTVEDVCAYLRISPHQVKALESDDFSALPESTITRGFIRNYARLLGIDAGPLLQAYQATAPSVTPRSLTLKSENILITGKDKRHWLKYIVASFFIAFLLGAWQFYMDYMPKPSSEQMALPIENVDTHEDENAKVAAESTAEITVTELLPIAALPAAEREAEEGTQTNASSDNATTNEPAVAADTSSESPDSTKTSENLKLSFSQTSWVNIMDRNHKMIFDRIMPAGSEETVRGEPPFEVVIGNAPGSKLIYKDKLIDLAPYTKSNVARVTLE